MEWIEARPTTPIRFVFPLPIEKNRLRSFSANKPADQWARKIEEPGSGRETQR